MYTESDNAGSAKHSTPASPTAPSSGIGSLLIHKTASPSTLTEVPAPTSAESGPAEAGKGGKEGQPPLPPSNAAFVAHVFRGLAEGARAAVCSKEGNPEQGGWIAEAASDVDMQCPGDRNNHFNCSSYMPDENGAVQARKERFSAFHALVLDDVGTKVDRAKLAGIEPSWNIETSPGNSQVGFCLTDPLTDLAVVKLLQDAVMAADLCDRGAGGSARWSRLPHAINGKPKHRGEAGKPFVCRVVRWNPDATYTVEELTKALGLKLTPLRPLLASSTPRGPKTTDASAVGSDIWTPAPDENPVVSALKERGLYKRQIGPGKHDITCPWFGEHTDGIDGGSAYFEPDDNRPVGGYRCQHSHGNKYHVGQLIKFLGVEPDGARGKARIRIVPGEINRVRRASELALALRGSFYQYGGAIVSISTDPLTKDVSINVLGEPALAAALADAADWERWDGRSKAWTRTDPPIRNVQSLQKAQEYVFLPSLTGLARQPFFRESDGVLVSEPGYDAVSGRFAAFDPNAFRLPEPTEAAAREALGVLQALLSEFRFATEEDRSAALSGMLTAAVRPSLPVAPAFNITASAPGSGKSYLASTLTPFAGPGVPLKVSYPTSAEEASKAMIAALAPAPAAIVFDDMQTPWLPHGAMNRMLTSETMTDRLLGVSRTVTVGTRVLVLGTGNNIGPVRDMSRRVVTIKIRHQVATPALEKYAGNPAETVAANRGKFVAAALTIIGAWKRAGSPRADVPSIASYGTWSDLCRQPLLWLGLADPASSLIDQVSHDPDQDLLGCLLRIWHEEFGDQPIMVRRLLDEASNNDELDEALLELPILNRGVIDRNRLGWFFRQNANRVVNGLELQKAEFSQRTAWRVVAIAQDGIG